MQRIRGLCDEPHGDHQRDSSVERSWAFDCAWVELALKAATWGSPVAPPAPSGDEGPGRFSFEATGDASGEGMA